MRVSHKLLFDAASFGRRQLIGIYFIFNDLVSFLRNRERKRKKERNFCGKKWGMNDEKFDNNEKPEVKILVSSFFSFACFLSISRILYSFRKKKL